MSKIQQYDKRFNNVLVWTLCLLVLFLSSLTIIFHDSIYMFISWILLIEQWYIIIFRNKI